MLGVVALTRRLGLRGGAVPGGAGWRVMSSSRRPLLTCAFMACGCAALAAAPQRHGAARNCFSVDAVDSSSGAMPRQDIDGVWVVRAIVADENGDSCFRVLHIPVASTRGTDPNSLGALSKLFPASGLQFRQTPGNYKYDWHRAPRRQFIVNLDAAVRVTASAPGAGSITLQPGEVFWVGDTTGKGHKSQAVDGQPRRSLFVTVPDDLNVEQWLQGASG